MSAPRPGSLSIGDNVVVVPLTRLTERARSLGFTGMAGLGGYALLRFVAIPTLNRWMKKTGARFQHYSPGRDRCIPVAKLSTKMLLDIKRDDLSAHPWWEVVRALPIKGGVVIDVGANVGVTSIWLAEMAERVYAFEPSPESQTLMREQLALRRVRNVELVPAAVSDKDGSATLFVTTSSMAHSLARVGNNRLVSEVSVPTVTLDRFAADRKIGVVDLLKIDTEGFEPDVVRGAGRLLSGKRVRHILFEYSPRFYADRRLDPAGVLRQLGDLGYAIFDLTGAPVEAEALVARMEQVDLLARPT